MWLSIEGPLDMRLCEILEPQHVKVPLEGETRDETIAELVDILADQGKVHERDQALQAVLRRESAGSTGIGRQIAVPHAKTDSVDELIMAVGRCKTDVDFDSVDNQPVRLVFLLLGPTDRTAPHIQALTRLSRMMNSDDFRKSLLDAKNSRDLYDLMVQQEAAVVV